MDQETINILIYASPLIVGGILAILNEDSINDSTEKIEAWTRNAQAKVSAKSNWFYRYVRNPILWAILRFCDWTDSFTHRGLKNGTRVAAILYLIGVWCYLIFAGFIIIVALAIGALTIYIAIKILANSNDEVKRGYEKGQRVFVSKSQNKNTNLENLEYESKDMKRGGYFSVRAIWSDGTPAKDVGVMIVYSGLITGPIGEKRTNGDGWVEFHNRYIEPGTIWVHGYDMGNHSLSDGKTYSFTI